MARIEAFVHGLSEAPHALLLRGEAGIGKTTLWTAGLESARLLGFRVLSCRPVESETRLSFSALADLLQTVPESAFGALPVMQRRAIEVAMLRAEVAGDPPDRRAVAVALLSVLRMLTQDRPVLMAVDDLPWLDRASMRTLEYVLRRIEAEPVGLLATSRAAETSAAVSALEHALPPGRLDHLEIRPLTLGAFGSILNARRVTQLRRPTLLRLFDAAGGNPFFGLELAAALDAVGREPQPGEPLPVPASLRALMRNRISSLPPEAQHVALLVASAARPALDLVLAAIGGDPNEREALDVAAAAGIIGIVGQEVRFAHPLLRSLLYSEASSKARREAHKRLAEATREPEERARHLALAVVGPDESVASELDVAAQAAYRRGAPDAAAELADLALTFTPPSRSATRVTRLVEAGELHFAAFDPDLARKLLEQAVTSSEPGPTRANARHRLAKVIRYSETGPASVRLLRQALAEAGHDTSLEAAIHRDLGFVSRNIGDRSGDQHYHAALGIAQRIGDRALTAQMIGLLAAVDFMSGHGVRRDLIEASLHGANSTEHLTMELRPRVVVSHILCWSDDLAGARAVLREEYVEALNRGAETDLPLLMVWLIELEVRAGDWDLAERYAKQGSEAMVSSGADLPAALLRGARSELNACRGRVEEAREDSRVAIELGERGGWHAPVQYGIHTLGFLDLSMDNVASAHARLEPLAHTVLEHNLFEPGVARFLPDDVECLVRLGRLDEAERLLRPFEDAARRLERLWALATAHRCRALLETVKGRHQGAAAAVEAALAAHQHLTMPFELGRTHMVAGEAYRRARQKLVARKHVERAREIFKGLGAPLWIRKADEELGRLGLSRSSAEGLTPAERRVVELAAAGRSNREIAQEMFMGLRTVEAHLTHGYGKLGVRRRTQLGQALERLARM